MLPPRFSCGLSAPPVGGIEALRHRIIDVAASCGIHSVGTGYLSWYLATEVEYLNRFIFASAGQYAFILEPM